MDNVSLLVSQLRTQVRRHKFKKLLQSPAFKAGSHKHFYYDIIGLFMDAYVAAGETDLDILIHQLTDEDEVKKRILIEAAFASIAVQDLVKPSEFSRIDYLHDKVPGSVFLMYQGLGGAFASTDLVTTSLSTLKQNFFGWMALDCFGFHKGYFEWASTIDRMAVPAHLDELGRYAFDCGVGRAIWLIACGEPRVVVELISRFAPQRRAALWAGIGLYAAFLGTYDQGDLKTLRKLAGPRLHYFQEGVSLGSFILHDCQRALPHTKAACDIICGASHAEVVGMATEQLMRNSTGDVTAENFYNWKQNMSGFYALHG